jgi:hypothetical protein
MTTGFVPTDWKAIDGDFGERRSRDQGRAD